MRPFRIALWVLVALSVSSAARAQNGPIQGVTLSSSGRPAGGVHVAICQNITTTAAAVANNVATLTFASNPITQGFTLGASLVVSGFTGGDTYLNGTYPIAGLSATTISYALTHANASAGTNGAVYQIGTSSQACAALATLYTDNTGATTTPNPLTSDGNGNYNVWAAPGYYIVQYYGSTIRTSIFFSGVSCVPSTIFTCGGLNGAGTSPQVAFFNGLNTVGGSANFGWASPAPGLNINSTSNNANNCNTAVLSLTNSNNGSTAGIMKQGNGSLAISVDCALIPAFGFLRWSTDGGATGDIDLRAGSNGANLYCNTVANIGITLPQGSCDWEFPNGGVGSAKYQWHSGVPNSTTFQWESANGCILLFTPASSTNSGSLCPPASGSPARMNLPTTTSTTGTNSSGQFLKSDGATPQILSWVTPFVGEYCGATTGATQACAKTLQAAPIIVHGDVQLNTATTQSITTLPFADGTYSCSGSDLTTPAGVVSFSSYAAASVTIQETGGANTDHLRYTCVGN